MPQPRKHCYSGGRGSSQSGLSSTLSLSRSCPDEPTVTTFPPPPVHARLAQMPDRFSKAIRSNIMRHVRRSGNKTTELRMISILRAAGITGWRRHWPLEGRPDFAFPARGLAVFVDGCFWHGCPRCYTAPASNKLFWRRKLLRNKLRDITVGKSLHTDGWRVLRFWECTLNNPRAVVRRMRRALASS